ncbi:MAG: hypothetical protein U5L46_11305 [Agrobacterium sp.]|nr:hypothetical protein [Agrobacterium sp.]
MNIQHELDYLSELLTAQSKASIDLGESLIVQWKGLDVPDRFETLEQANGFVLELRGRITPTVTRLYDVIANAYNDDLGNQSIRRIRTAMDTPILRTIGSKIALIKVRLICFWRVLHRTPQDTI